MRTAVLLVCSLAGCTRSVALVPVQAPTPTPTVAAPAPIATAQRTTTPHPFVDQRPPEGWRQCAGFVNTSGDDIGDEFFAPCIGGDRLRVRVFTSDNALEEDVFVTGITPMSAWPDGYFGDASTLVKQTYWGGLDGGAPSVFFAKNDGTDACFQPAAPTGSTLGSGHAQKAIIVADATGYDEYRISCGREALPDRKIALYR